MTFHMKHIALVRVKYMYLYAPNIALLKEVHVVNCNIQDLLLAEPRLVCARSFTLEWYTCSYFKDVTSFVELDITIIIIIIVIIYYYYYYYYYYSVYMPVVA